MLNDVKANFLKASAHFIVFDQDGHCLESEGQLISPNLLKGNLFENFSFLESNRELLSLMMLHDSYSFPCMNVQLEQSKEAYCDFTLQKVLWQRQEANLWMVHDQTEMYLRIMQLQQDRNEKAISGEFFEMKQRALNAERDLLKFKNEELKRQQEFKTQFYARLSHELRTPLHSISGLSTLLSEKQKAHQQAKYLNALQATSRHLLSIVNNVIDFSRIETGKMTWQAEPTALKDLIEEVIASFRYKAEEKRIEIKVTYAEDFPLTAQLDATKLKQILFNLIGNAVKFTDRGYVLLEAALTDKDQGFIELTVIDTGPGIAKEKEQDLFKPYVQLSNNGHVGSGLGLSIVKQLCDLSGGNITYIRPESGSGVTFRVTLPYLLPEKQIDKPSEELPLESHIQKMLIADDDEINCQVLVTYCKKYNIEAEAVSTGKQAIEKLMSNSYDLLILDYYMPNMDGLETLKALKKKELHQKKPVFMLTGSMSPTIKEEVLSAGVKKVIVKPIQPNALIELIRFDVPTDQSGINLDYLYKISDGNALLIKELIKKFLDTVPSDFAKIKQHQDGKDPFALQKMLHKSKINMKYVGMQGAFEKMEKLEETLSSGNVPVNLKLQISDLEKQVNAAVIKLKAEFKSL